MDGETIQRAPAPRAQFQPAQPPQLQQQPPVAQAPPQQQFQQFGSAGSAGNSAPGQQGQYQQPVRQVVPPPATTAPGGQGSITSFAGIRQNIPQQGSQQLPVTSQPIRPQPLQPQQQPQLRRLDSHTSLQSTPQAPIVQPPQQNQHQVPYPRPLNPQGPPQQPGVRPQPQPGLVQRPPNYPPNVVPNQAPRPQQPIQVPQNRGQFPQQLQQQQPQQQPLQQPRPQFIRQPGPQQGSVPGPRPGYIAQPQRPIQPPLRQPGIYQQNPAPFTMASEVAAPPKVVDNAPSHLQAGHNDDDDVVMGRMQTPSYSPVPPVQSRPPSSNVVTIPVTQNNNSPATTTFGKISDSSKSPSPQPPQTTFQQQPIQKSDSQRSVPSRPPSVIENTKPVVPETNGMQPKPVPYTNSAGSVRTVNPEPVQTRPKPVESTMPAPVVTSAPVPVPAAVPAPAVVPAPAIRPVNPPAPSARTTFASAPQKPPSAQSSVEDTTEHLSGPIQKTAAPQVPYKETPRPPVISNSVTNQEPVRQPSSQRSDRENLSARGKPSIADTEPISRKPPPGSLGRMPSKGDNDSGVDESTQGNERNGPGSPGSPVKSPTKIPGLSRPPSTTPSIKSRSTSKSRLTDKTPEAEPVKKAVPMNKIQVGGAPSPNLKAVKSKIGSLENATHKPGGGRVKIESKKVEIKAAPRIAAKNDAYVPGGGDKKIVQTKLQWSAKSKIGSLENAHHKPGGGDKKIESQKLEFKAKPKVGSKDYIKHVPGGGDVKIQTHKVEVKAQSKIGSLDNMKHKPGGGDKKIFDDKDYLRSIEHPITPTPPTQPWRSTSLSTSMSLPAECLVLSVTAGSSYNPSVTSAQKRQRSAKSGRVIHPQPFRNY
ncbi:microtubule-associated protein tau isoform X3 [Phlebotomus papatasi]|uniref:microtubule-associated protein tau isoform X3 n=1 Tax=Phlebotomus papatasi TaxID=29031 RepID=UPI002483C1F2|nr:microtubule-associated protein tau isoform X3 [Phlebotomus papatasi]